ncbi:MAG: hypothetical protein LBF38_10695 [Deltaproteobacteria bacterium]|jgi:hypothetical protein|nr:hypothetical protein [Deltaproteobacteria bacterium]
MALPKALLCILGKNGSYSGEEQELSLRAVGFATATLRWSDFRPETNDWLGLSEILEDPAVAAWVIAGPPEAFSQKIISQISVLTLALDRKPGPVTAFVTKLADKSDLGLPPILSHVKVFDPLDPYAAKLMAYRFKPPENQPRPFYLKTYASPLIGLWLEVGPNESEKWSGFMLAVTKTLIDVLGVGPRGQLPQKSTVNYPMHGLEGQLGDLKFNASAAKNTLDAETSAFIRLAGPPNHLIVAPYPEENPVDQESSGQGSSGQGPSDGGPPDHETWAQVLALA